MRTRIFTAMLLAAAAFPAAADASSRGPTPAQIRAAVSSAERSRDLWATVNICNTRRHPDVVGIRGQIPSLGFKTLLYMDIQVEYWSLDAHRFVPDPGVRKLVGLGTQTLGLHQDGATFQFQPHAGALDGIVTFEWRLAGKVLGRVARRTSHGEKHVDFGDPPGYSIAVCTIS